MSKEQEYRDFVASEPVQKILADCMMADTVIVEWPGGRDVIQKVGAGFACKVADGIAFSVKDDNDLWQSGTGKVILLGLL
jgi:hypothetical protein